MPDLFIYAIHTVLYQDRQQMLHQAVQCIRELALKHDYQVNLTFMTKPDPSMIDIKEMESRISYKPVNDPLFDANMPILSLQQLSQLLKHEAVWNKIIQNGSKNVDNLHLVIEDDIIITDDSKQFIQQLFQSKGRFENEWDILFLGLMSGVVPTEPLGIRSTQNEYRILPCKEAYFIKPKTAFKLKGGLTTIRYDTRIYLSYMIATLNLASFYLNKRITVDTSKLGIVPSTVRTNNLLILNAEAMKLHELAQETPTDVERYLERAKSIYDSLQQFNSGNIIYSYAQCHIQAKKYKEALQLLEQAAAVLQGRKGCIGNNSTLVQDMVRIHANTQSDLPELLAKKSKWVKIEPIQ
jgi:GR25 family glycosyltransferase involved in LPS biosynthesis